MTKAKGGRAARRTNRPAATETGLSLSHLRRESRTALELAVVALAPADLIDRLAAAAGLLEAIIELPANSPPALALVPPLVERTRATLDEWQTWHRENLQQRMPRG